jgi:hypothetical protein
METLEELVAYYQTLRKAAKMRGDAKAIFYKDGGINCRLWNPETKMWDWWIYDKQEWVQTGSTILPSGRLK